MRIAGLALITGATLIGCVQSSGGWGVTPDGASWVPQVTDQSRDYGIGVAPDGEGAAYIDPHGETGTFQIGLASTYLFTGELVVRGTWSDVPGATGTLGPIMLVAERFDEGDHVRAELIENLDDHTMKVDVVWVQGGANTYVAEQELGLTHNARDWWYLRFQFDDPDQNSVLNARAWKMGTPEPTTWQVSGPTELQVAGTVGVRSENSNAAEQPIVYYDDFGVSGDYSDEPGL